MALQTFYIKSPENRGYYLTVDTDKQQVTYEEHEYPFQVTIDNLETGKKDAVFYAKSIATVEVQDQFVREVKGDWGITETPDESITWNWTTIVYPDGTVTYNALGY